MTEQSAPAVRAEGLVKVLGGRRVVDGVDLEVPAGTVHALLGPNGAGKTTTVRLVTTLLRPDEGTAVVAGHDVRSAPDAARASLGLSGQYSAVDERLSGYENLQMLGRLYGLSRPASRDRANELLERFRLDDIGPRRVGAYSGGMKRRLDLAAALVARPQVVVLDEPTTGLDPRSRLDMWGVIEDLLTDGVAVLLTTQYLEEADRLADIITVIDEGRIIARGTSTELKDRVQGSRLEVQVDPDSSLETAAAALRRSGTGDSSVDERTRRVEVAVDGGPSVAMRALRALEDDGVTLTDVALHRSTLDDVFLALTGHPPAEDEAAYDEEPAEVAS
ncbi:ATP-binding cassette domain-containing protein [Marmoricola endophyticus]|uniref:ATP-binding cassette domain-containing protein n=1 Tax=Marmoricola endophyticus TaxID=2040280 RepID=UPI001668DCDE|nr:ATP-binding cassette domain-containing protein [Marmoricola endophyticus]